MSCRSIPTLIRDWVTVSFMLTKATLYELTLRYLFGLILFGSCLGHTPMIAASRWKVSRISVI